MAKPNNFNDENCESKSSSCVIWAGPKIECINLCPGDNITVAINSLATELCTIMDQLDISNYDLTCLNISNGAPSDFTTFINILIQKICTLSGDSQSFSIQSSSDLVSTDPPCGNCMVNLATCFQYTDPSNGDLVVTSPISDYVQRIGISICTILSTITSQQNAIGGLANRVTSLENINSSTQPYSLPLLFPVCIGDPLTALSLDAFVKSLEQAYCNLSGSVGSTNDVYKSITAQPADFNSAKALGTGGGTMGEKAGFVLNPANLSDTVTNVWKTIADLRSAIMNIQQNCCNTLCDGIELVFSATLETKVLKLFFTGSIPDNLVACLADGAIFKIADYSGNYVNVSVNIKNNLNNVSGAVVDLNSTPLNFADDLKITSLFCFNDPETGSMCQNYLETIVSNNLTCPTLTVSPGLSSVSYQFIHNSGTLTYSVQLFNSSNVMIQSQNISVSDPVVISNMFSSLNNNTAYKIRLQLITANSTKTCVFTPFITLSNPCPAVLSVSATISIT